MGDVIKIRRFEQMLLNVWYISQSDATKNSKPSQPNILAKPKLNETKQKPHYSVIDFLLLQITFTPRYEANPCCAILCRKCCVSYTACVNQRVSVCVRAYDILSLHIIFLMIYKHSWILVIDFYCTPYIIIDLKYLHRQHLKMFHSLSITLSLSIYLYIYIVYCIRCWFNRLTFHVPLLFYMNLELKSRKYRRLNESFTYHTCMDVDVSKSPSHNKIP